MLCWYGRCHVSVFVPRAQPLGRSGVRTSQHFYWPPILNKAFNKGGRFNSFVWNVFLFSFKSRFFQDCPLNYTPDLNDLKFENSKFRTISGEGLTKPPLQTPPRSFSGFALDSGLQLLKPGCAHGFFIKYTKVNYKDKPSFRPSNVILRTTLYILNQKVHFFSGKYA